ncbi:MAG: DUF503 domain-containing protein [Anaerolineae bacterium]|jgi:hypothetical protein|nr:DUF503 domain-containing protein [Anaerolineae bacterium]
MSNPILGLCTVELYLPESHSLKDKRSILKSMLTKLHNQFNVSAAEIDKNDSLQSAVIAFSTVSNSSRLTNEILQNALKWLEAHYPEALVTRQTIEIL